MIEALEREALRAWAGDLAAAPARWAAHVRHRAGRRVSVPLDAPTGTAACLVCWMPGHDTGFQGHEALGAIALVKGSLRVERRAGAGVRSRTYSVGDVLDIDPGDIHRIAHVGGEPAVSIHVQVSAVPVKGDWPLTHLGSRIPA